MLGQDKLVFCDICIGGLKSTLNNYGENVLYMFVDPAVRDRGVTFEYKNGNLSHIFHGTGGSWYIKPGTSNGNVYIQGYTALSDERLKDDIVPATCGLSDLVNLQPRHFKWKDSDVMQTGFVAQEVESVTPCLVRMDDDGYKSIDYQGLTAMMVASIQELTARV